MKPPRKSDNELILGLVSISDRASRGVYRDEGIPALEDWMRKAVKNPMTVHKRLIPDERFEIEKTLRELVDVVGCDLILTTGGTGPSRRDVTPEATLSVGTREMPGFGEQMRAISGHFVPTAILSRQVAVLRETPDHAALIINLPGRPKAIAETLEGLKDENGRSLVNGIFAAVPYCIDLIEGPYIETNESVVKAFRPKNAVKKPAAPARPAEPEPPAQPEAAPFAPEELLMTLPRNGAAPALTVVWLHGMGADHHDFENFAEEIVRFGGPACRFVLPNAPMRALSAFDGHALRAWYDIGRKLDENEDVAGIRESARRIERLIETLEANGIARDRIVLGGFSQGAAVTLYHGLRLNKPLAGLIALSGYLPAAGRLFAEAGDAGRRLPTLMCHGRFDSVVSPLLAQRSADVIGEVNPTFRFELFDMDHEVCGEEMRAIAAFLQRLSAR